MCIRDVHGRFVLAKTQWISPMMNIAVVEAIGLLTALNWVKDLHLYDMDFEIVIVEAMMPLSLVL
jgi:hypothetical protein